MDKHKQLKRYLEDKCFNQNDNFNSIVLKIREEKKDMNNRKSILGIVATICILALGTTGLAFAKTKLKNDTEKGSRQIKIMNVITAEKDGDVIENSSHLYNVDISVKEISTKGLSLQINDKNDKHYTYPNHYEIRQIEESNEYLGTGEIIGKTTTNSTSGYTGNGTTHVQKILSNISNIASEDTVQINVDGDEIDISIDWESIYGELHSGQYLLVLDGTQVSINVSLYVSDSGDINYTIDKISFSVQR